MATKIREPRTLTYWVAKCLTDSDSYSIRAKTRTEVLKDTNYNTTDYAKPIKVQVHYTDAMDLLKWCLGEGRAMWETAK